MTNSFRGSLILLILLLFGSGVDLADQQDEREPEFTFLRLKYSGYARRGWGLGPWATDYPKADIQFLYGLGKLSDFSFVAPTDKALDLEDPQLFDYPFAYAVEVGYMFLSDGEAANLRKYLLRGGFLVVDDFHGSYEWGNFYRQIKKALPEYEPQDLDVDHPIFHCYFDIQELYQVPGYQTVHTGRTWERDGTTPHYRAILDEKGRIMVMINHNVDLGDAWEWAERPEYPRRYADLAFKLGINYIVYSMTH